MKLISWNVNGFRAVLKKNFEENFHALNADFFCAVLACRVHGLKNN